MAGGGKHMRAAATANKCEHGGAKSRKDEHERIRVFDDDNNYGNLEIH